MQHNRLSTEDWKILWVLLKDLTLFTYCLPVSSQMALRDLFLDNSVIEMTHPYLFQFVRGSKDWRGEKEYIAGKVLWQLEFKLFPLMCPFQRKRALNQLFGWFSVYIIPAYPQSFGNILKEKKKGGGKINSLKEIHTNKKKMQTHPFQKDPHIPHRTCP